MWPNAIEELDGEGQLDNRMPDALAGPGWGHLLWLQKHRYDVHSGTWATRRAAACLGSLSRVFTQLAGASAFPACSRSSELKSQKASELRSPALASILGKH